uniref:RRM domain-containing protein n=1 Tax=Echeneis naucrates TaxID=173247 RepID=A0A665U7I9_ECHNA
MYLFQATICRKRKRKVVTSIAVEEETNVSTDGQTESTEMENQDEQDSHMGTVTEVKASTPTVNVSWEKKNKEGQGEQSERRATSVNVKRKAHADTEISPPKKTKHINDGYCVFVGNLNNSKTLEEVRDSLGRYFMTQSLLVQDIRVDRLKKHAFVDFASEMDLTKALTLNGEMILDNPVRIAKAKAKTKDEVKAPRAEKKANKNARCLFLKNVPYNATMEDIVKVFDKAVAVRFPGGAKAPIQGIAFVEFKNEKIAKETLQTQQNVKIQDRVLIVGKAGETYVPKVTEASEKEDDHTKAAVPPNKILFVSNLSFNLKEEKLSQIFQKAVSIQMPKSKGKSKGYAFVKFATVADAKKALQASQNIKLSKRPVRVQFFEMREKPEKKKVLLKTLIVMGLSKKTTVETLQVAFEGAISARMAVDKEAGGSKSFGFVEFENEEICKAVKESMQDVEIDGSKVTVAYAKQKTTKRSPKDKRKGGSAS